MSVPRVNKTGKNDIPEVQASTVSVLHQHSHSVSTKEKIYLPFLFLGIGAVIVAVAMVVWDHTKRSYARAPDLENVVVMAAKPPAESGGIGALINPDDSPYVAFQIRGWQFWSGKVGIAKNHYLRIPELQAETMEQLVKGGRAGAASLVFQVDLGTRDGNAFQVDKILRGGMPTTEPPVMMELYPLTAAARPAISSSGEEGTYVEAVGIRYETEGTFKNIGRFTALGLLQKGEKGFWLQSRKFNVALSDEMDPGMAAFLGDMAGNKVTENMMFFLELRETYPWTEDGKPGRRQSEGDIGLARLDGVLVGKHYFANGAG
jgi:hypothetical protein